MRNAFEENDKPEAQEFMKLYDKILTILPPLPEGERYELVKLHSGRTAVTVEKDGEATPPAEPERDKFGRPYHG